MSSFTQHPQGPGQVVSIGPYNSPGNPDGDGILGLSQQLETALAVGREQIRKLRDDVLAMQSRFQHAHQEAERRLHESQGREQQLGSRLSALQQAASQREKVLTSEIASQRERADSLQRDLDNALRSLDQARTEARQKLEAAARREENLKAELTGLRGIQEGLNSTISQLQARVTQLQEAAEKSRGEVDLYKSSWSQVLQMERDARAYLSRRDETDSKIRALESRNADLLSEAKNRIRELEATRQTLAAQLEQSRKEAAQATERLAAEQAAVAEERANAGCALKAAEEAQAQAARAHEHAQAAVTEAREQSHVAVTRAREEAAQATARAAAAEARLGELRAQLDARPIATVSATSDADDSPIQIEVADLGDELNRISSARTHLETERDALKAQLAQAIREANEAREKTERMRRSYPLRDLLRHKEAELSAAVRELKKLGEDAPARDKAEEIVETLSEQRDQLRKILRESGLGAPGA